MADIKKISDYIFLDSKPEAADLTIIFGTRHPEATQKAWELYNKGFFKKILVSGGINRITHKNEADTLSQQLTDLGVNKDDIILENKSKNSLENVLFSKEVIDKKIGLDNIKKILVITKHYHIRRALMTLKKHFPKNIKFIPAPYKISGFDKSNWNKTKIGKEKVISEWNKIKKYLKQGDIEEL